MEATLEALRRESTGKNEARRLRREGRIPGVVYGAVSKAEASDALPVAVDPKALLKILHSESGANTLISLKLDKSEARVIVKEFQLDPLSRQLLHADFYRVAMDRAITVTVPVQLKGEPRGVKQQAGLLEFVLREVEIQCLPGDIPEHLTVDVSELLIGQGIRVRDLAEDARWQPVSDVEAMVVHVIAPKGEEPSAEAEAAAGPEPEVIKKGKGEKEGES